MAQNLENLFQICLLEVVHYRVYAYMPVCDLEKKCGCKVLIAFYLQYLKHSLQECTTYNTFYIQHTLKIEFIYCLYTLTLHKHFGEKL